MGSNVPVMNESTNELIYEIDYILNCGYEINSISYIVSFVDSLITRTLQPTNDQLPTSVAS